VNTCLSGLVGVLVDSALELLQELVNIEKITLRPQVGERQGVRVVHRWVCRLSNHGTTVAVLTHTTALVAAATTAAENRELHSLEAHQSLANIIVSVRVNGTAFGIAEKLV
jgi:hypothetical protein